MVWIDLLALDQTGFLPPLSSPASAVGSDWKLCASQQVKFKVLSSSQELNPPPPASTWGVRDVYVLQPSVG